LIFNETSNWPVQNPASIIMIANLWFLFIKPEIYKNGKCMIIGNKIYFITILFVLISIACSNNDSGKETQKLIQAQNEMLERYEKTDESLREIKSKSDSLITKMKLLKNKKEKAEQDLQKLTQEKGVESDHLNKKKQEDLEEKISALEDQLIKVENQLNHMEKEGREFNERKDTIYVNQKPLFEPKLAERERLEKVEKKLKAKLDSTEGELTVKKSLLEISQQKIALAQKKIHVLENEKEIYIEEKNALIRNNDTQNTISRYDNKIRKVNEDLSNEHQEIEEAENNISLINDELENLAQIRNKLESALNKMHSEKEPVDSNGLRETEYKTEELNNELQNQKEIKKALNDEKSETGDNNKILDILSGKSLDDKKAQSEDDTPNDKDSLNRLKSSRSKNVDVETLKNVENTINQKKDQMNNLRQEVKTEAKKLEEKQKNPPAEKKKNVSRFTKIITVVIAIALVMFIILYLVGKKGNTSK